MTIVERLRKEAEAENCVPLTPLLNAAAEHIESLEQQLENVRKVCEGVLKR
ncbi:MAG: hypothetical protein QF471_05365 [Phycisphaerales bacterium]|jgi:sigma54-dependent transcription regulator|nr:hypothetical protein [Phycisphaerales bacterium]|tara:strand:- start:135 stop:287 length:153 start_codon:yes stop_codon:yes gene_type:complete